MTIRNISRRGAKRLSILLMVIGQLILTVSFAQSFGNIQINEYLSLGGAVLMGSGFLLIVIVGLISTIDKIS